MSWPYDLTTGSFVFLVPRAPTVVELQAALDTQDFLGRLMISLVEPVQVPSDTPPLHEWRGWLDGKDVSFRIGAIPPAKLPGASKDHPSVQSWPLAIWSTDSGQADVVAAGVMATYSWAVVMQGAAYVPSKGAMHDLPERKRWIDIILTYNSGREDALRARYPDIPPPRQPQPGEETTVEIRVY